MFSCIGVWTGGYPELAYALSVAVVSVAACIGIQTAEFYKPGVLEKVEKPVSLALLLWWAIGTGIITFRGPFYTVTNGYIAAWAGLYFTAHWAIHIDTTKFVELDTGRKTVALLGVSGVVVVLACIQPIHVGRSSEYSAYGIIYGKSYLGPAAWGLSGSLMSTLLCVGLFLKFDDINGKIMKVTGERKEMERRWEHEIYAIANFRTSTSCPSVYNMGYSRRCMHIRGTVPRRWQRFFRLLGWVLGRNSLFELCDYERRRDSVTDLSFFVIPINCIM